MGEGTLEVGDGIAVVTLAAAPERRNGLPVPMATELMATLDAIDAPDDVGTVVARRPGGSSCARPTAT